MIIMLVSARLIECSMVVVGGVFFFGFVAAMEKVDRGYLASRVDCSGY